MRCPAKSEEGGEAQIWSWEPARRSSCFKARHGLISLRKIVFLHNLFLLRSDVVDLLTPYYCYTFCLRYFGILFDYLALFILVDLFKQTFLR